MNYRILRVFKALIVVLFISACAEEQVPEQVSEQVSKQAINEVFADTILSNAKVLTVDQDFSIASAVAIKGERIIAVGSDEAVSSYKGSATRVIDLMGKTVIPGLIDNHIHFIRAGQSWHVQARIDGVDSRKEALDIIAKKAATMEPGQWLMVQGGWWPDQFIDDPSDFTVEELDAVAPNNPLFIQMVYFRAYANTPALEAVGADPAKGARHNVGELINRHPPYGKFNEQITVASKAQIKQNVLDVITRFNRAGLTSVYDVGRPPEGDIALLREMHEERPLNMRVWHTLKYEAFDEGDVDSAIALIKSSKANNGDYLGLLGVGEHAYLPFFDGPRTKDTYSDDIVTAFGKISRAAAEQGLRMNEHAMQEPTIKSALDEWEQINKDIPLAPLRWSLEHLFTPTDAQLIRMREMGVTAAVHGVAQTLHSGVQPPMQRMQELDVIWGLGSDGTIVTPFQPFLTIGWAVTGKAFNDQTLFEDTVSREDALVAHTRSNAFLLFKEKDIGSLEVGKFADLAVLNKDYLTVPEDEIFHIESELTMVAGRVVYDTLTQ